MITKSDWQAAHERLTAEERERAGVPPTAEDILAYERGSLGEADAERVRRGLVAYPELARAFATSFDTEDGEPLGDDVIDRQWVAFSQGTGRAAGGRVLQFWRGFSAIAATIAIAFGAMLWQARTELRQPRVMSEEHILTPDGRRGAGEDGAAITSRGGSYLLVVSLVGPADYERYRLEIVSGAAHKPVWSSEPLRRSASDSFDVAIPSRFLAPGRSQVIVYGLRGPASERVSTYTIDLRRELDRGQPASDR